MSYFADLLSTLFERASSLGKLSARKQAPLDVLCRELLTSKGEVSGATLAQAVLNEYTALDDADKLAFFCQLRDEFDLNADAAKMALSVYQQNPDQKNYATFMHAVDPQRQELIRRLNQVPGATAQLVAMRQDLLRLAKDNPDIAIIDYDFKTLFLSWFNRGFLVIRPINWASPAHILEKIIAYEAVHEIDSWDDLRRRLQPEDRRCFAFFHPSMPDEPLIFVQVALTDSMAHSIQAILSDDREAISADTATTATFYSISNCQQGLAGISFGNSLIKTVVQTLSRELPSLSVFVTLSPIPGFKSWCNGRDLQTDNLDTGDLRRLVAHYLLNAKRADNRPLDPVARFHLNNGARVQAIHGDADISPKGKQQSAGLMVNYLYDVPHLADNHEAFATHNKVAASSGVQNLASEAIKQFQL
ncbi:malonyl-CoA decarboxylase [Candidatus Puniceispirillum marinum]|uniref:Malonyl-CoA decarboxylase n=1 Tax=Puniceispirillum marinum (strain IMCC1322) TaxID=488538 RepID=D5BS68_PUNMI|nr:malonyl-CoA decarboxylase [Candidatus Puniceispirillum marinum]ADE39115.1 malonyl-CoA decarboxylase [Candidatus Puniceispirillum marinum IMCC1322]